MTQLRPEDILEEIRRARSGGGSTTAKGGETTWLSTYSPTQLRYAWRAGLITEEDWLEELIARKETPQSARAEIEKQKATGVSTALKTKGQLTEAEQAGVNALKSAGITGRPTPVAQPTIGETGQPITPNSPVHPFRPSAAFDAAHPIDPVANPVRASGAVGPGGRTFDQVTGTDYVNDAERQWYLAEAARRRGSTAVSATGGGAPSSGGGGSSSGSAKTAAAKPDDPGSTFTVRGKDGTTYHWREYTRADGSSYYRNLETGESSERLPTEAAAPKKLSPLEQAAQSLAGANRTLAGGEQAASSGQEGSSPATAPAAPGDPRLMIADNGTRLTGLDMPGYGTLNTVGRQNNVTDILLSNGLRPSGDPSRDLQTVLGVLGKRDLTLAQNPGMTALEYHTGQTAAAEQRAWDQLMADYQRSNPLSVSTPTINANKQIVPDDYSGYYRNLLQPVEEDPYAFAGGGGFDTRNPVGFVDMVTGTLLGMAGGAGRETIKVDPDGPHGTPATEAKVGSKLWPKALGVNAYANGIDDLMRDFTREEDPAGLQATVDYEAPASTPAYAPQMPRTGDPDVAGSQGPSFGGSNPSRPAHDKIEVPYMYPMSPYMEDLIIGPFIERALKKAGFPGTTASLLNAPDEVRSRVLGPRALAYINERATPGYFHDQEAGASLGQPSPMSQWLSRYFSTLPRSGRDFYQAEGGENTAGGASFFDNPPHPQRWGAGGMDDLLTWKGLVRSGAFENASRDWQLFTPQQQLGGWSLQRSPGMGTPWNGNTWLPAVSFRSMLLPNGQYWLQNDGNLAPTPPGTYAELQPNVYQPPANLQTFLNTPVGQNPTGGIVTQRTGPPTGAKGPVTMADGGMGETGPLTPTGSDVTLGREIQTPFSMLLETLLVKPTKGNRKPPLRPVGATMGGYAA